MRAGRPLSIVALLLALVATTVDRAMAQQTPAPPPSSVPSPRAAFEAFFTALARADGPAAAALIHPDALTAYRARKLAMAGAIAQATDGGRKSLRGTGGVVVQVRANTPPEVATKYGTTPVYHVPGVKTLGELAALSPADFAARVITAGGPTARAMMGGKAVAPEVVGTVPDGDTLAHVVYRSPFAPEGGDPLIPSVAVMSARRDAAGRWLLLPDTMIMSLFSVPRLLSPEY